MLRRGIFFVTVGLFFALFFSPNFVFAYDSHVGHPGIAALAVKSYNFQNNQDITDKQLQYILQGAQEEDTPMRWFNHFFDPVYNIGFSDFWLSDKLGSYPTSLEWLKSPYEQVKYADGDRSWQRALNDYARGDEANAFIELGHAIHLLSDMAVPAHTRDSSHPGDSYESFVKNNWSTVRSKITYGYTEVTDLEQAFRDLANYSNNNFYSDKTIESSKYNIIDLATKVFVFNKVNYLLNYDKNSGTILYVSKNNVGWKENYEYYQDKLDSSGSGLVLTDYSVHLIPQAINYSAGLIKLFLTEAEAKKAEMNYEEMSLWEQIKSVFVNSDLPTYRQTVSGYLMERTLTPAVEYGEDTMEEIVKAKEIITEPKEKVVEKPKILTKEKNEPAIVEPATTTVITTATVEEAEITVDVATSTVVTTTPIVTSSPVIPTVTYYNGGFSHHHHDEEENTTTSTTSTAVVDTKIFVPNLFLDFLQVSSTTQITLNFESTETTSLPVSFEGEINTNTSWISFFDLTTSTNYIYETRKSGDYEFRVRAIDAVGNTSSWTQTATTVPMISYEYNHLFGDQTEDMVTLTKEGSPYIIDNYYYVGDGKTLRVESGTVIKSLYLNEDDSGVLGVFGNLEVVGSETDKVVFTSVYDHDFDDDKLATLDYVGVATDGDWGGIRSFEGADLKMNNFEIRYAGERFDNEEYMYIAWLMTYFNKCLDLSKSTVEIENGKLEHCGRYAASFSNTNGYFKSSEINSFVEGVDVYKGDMLLENLKFSGFTEAPLTIESPNIEMNNLVFENNRLNGLADNSLSGDIVLSKNEIPYILDSDIFYQASSITAEPGAKIYINNNDYQSVPINFIGTADDPVKVFLGNVYWNALRLDGVDANFQYVNFVNESPFLNDLSADYYGADTVEQLMESDSTRAEFFTAGVWRASALTMKNGALNMENVNFINGVTPWQSSLYLTENSSTLKNVNFYNSKPNGIFYLDETNSRGIEVYGGTLDMDNVNFADLVYGVYYSPDSEFDTPAITVSNMSSSSFVNVLNISSPEGLVPLP